MTRPIALLNPIRNGATNTITDTTATAAANRARDRRSARSGAGVTGIVAAAVAEDAAVHLVVDARDRVLAGAARERLIAGVLRVVELERVVHGPSPVCAGFRRRHERVRQETARGAPQGAGVRLVSDPCQTR